MTDATGQATIGFAHHVVPEPDGAKYFDENVPADDLPGHLAAYHAARAWGFHLGSRDGQWPNGMLLMLAEYQIAKVWWLMATTDIPDSPAIAADVVADLASPHVIAPNIVTILEWAGVDPARILPYGVPVGSPS